MTMKVTGMFNFVCLIFVLLGAAQAQVQERHQFADDDGSTEPQTLREYCAGFDPRDDYDVNEQKVNPPSTEFARNFPWRGQYVDLFSPDETCKDSIRVLEMGLYNKSSYGNDKPEFALHVSGNATGKGCRESWGRAFLPLDATDPIMTTYMGSGNTVNGVFVDTYEAKISFAAKITNKSDPNYAYAQKGALNFTVRLGSVGPQGLLWKNVLVWSGMYNGQGGPFFDHTQRKVIQAPPSKCGNIWRQVANHPNSADLGSVKAELEGRGPGIEVEHTKAATGIEYV